MDIQIDTRKLKATRVRYDLNQSEMAKIIGTTEATYSRKENNKAPFYLVEAKKITDHINKLDRKRKRIIEDIFF